jgi:hypothetical protein
MIGNRETEGFELNSRNVPNLFCSECSRECSYDLFLSFPNTVFKIASFSKFFFVKGPAADATDAPQPWGLLCSPVMKMIRFFSVFRVMEHWWNEIDRGKTEVLGEKPVPLLRCPPQIPHGLTRDRTRRFRGERPATNRLSHGTAHRSIYYISLYYN